MRPRQLHRETYPRAMGILRESQVQEITFNNLGKKTWILKRQLWNIFLVENFWKSIALDIAVHWSGPANNWFEWFSTKLQSYWDQASSLICSIIRLIREIYWILGTIWETIKVWQNFMYFVFLKNYMTKKCNSDPKKKLDAVHKASSLFPLQPCITNCPLLHEQPPLSPSPPPCRE